MDPTFFALPESDGCLTSTLWLRTLAVAAIRELAVRSVRRIVAGMSTVTEIESAIERLSPEEQRALAEWLNARLIEETPEMLAAIDDADQSLATEGGVAVADVRRNLRQWITG